MKLQSFWLAFFALGTAWGQQSSPQSLEARLAAEVEDYALSANGSLDAFLQVAGKFHVPLGVEWTKPDRPAPTLQLSWRHSTVLGVLDDVVREYPGYAMEVRHGVVHVFPTAVRSDAYDILDLKLDSFRVEDQTVNVAAHSLAIRLKQILTPVGPGKQPHASAGSVASGLGDHPVSFSVFNVTVRDVLDELCLQAGLNVWVVAYPTLPARTRTGYLKTIRLDQSLPNDDDAFSPVFHFLAWNVRIGTPSHH